MTPALVIFDMDGVLVDSERIANRILHEDLRANGVDLTLEESTRSFVGRKAGWTVANVRERWGIVLPPDFEKRLRERTLASYEGELRAVDGIEGVLDALAVPYCLASSSDPVRIEHSLGLCGLAARFEGRAFSAVQVKNGKPAPDLFLFAARADGRGARALRRRRGHARRAGGGEGGGNARLRLCRRRAHAVRGTRGDGCDGLRADGRTAGPAYSFESRWMSDEVSQRPPPRAWTVA